MKLKIQKTAKVAVQGNPETAKYCWIVLHGYGQLADYFIRKFSSLDEKEHFVIAPEGIHRFYLKGTSGRVGASWMTKEERQDDITDNIQYLDQVAAELAANHSFEKVVVLGFSQGASTAARWIQQGQFPIDCFVQWAGVFPPDLELPSENNRFDTIRHLVVIGKQDPYFKNQDDLSQPEQVKRVSKDPKVIWFDGDHNIYPEPLADVCKDIVGRD